MINIKLRRIGKNVECEEENKDLLNQGSGQTMKALMNVK